MQLSKKVQEIVDKIAGERRTLVESVAGLSAAQLAYKSGGEWSIEDILQHMALTDESNVKLASGMLKQAEEKGAPLDAMPEESVLDSLGQFKEPLTARLKAPDRVAPKSRLPVEESLSRLAATRQQLLEVVNQLGRYDLTHMVWPHPFLGNLNMYQWLLLAGMHESRHAAQINRLKSEPGFPLEA